MKFLDNFSILPLDNIKKDSFDCDFFICCSSFEERCHRSSNILKINKIKIENSIIFNYIEKDSENKRDKNFKILQSNLEKISNKIHIFDKCSVSDPSKGIKEFKNFLLENSIDLAGKKIIVDISVFTKPYFFILLKLLTEEFFIDDFYVIYTEPGVYGKRNETEYLLTEGLFNISHIPGFHGMSVNTDDALVVLLGFEGNRTLDIYYNVNPDMTYAINGFPAFQPGWQKKSLELNRRFLSESKANTHLFNAPANDPFETKKVLENIVKEIEETRPDLDIVIAPLGTKLQALGVLLFALSNKKVRVIYPFPTLYSSNYSENFGNSWIFKINL